MDLKHELKKKKNQIKMKRYIILWLELKQIQIRSNIPAEKEHLKTHTFICIYVELGRKRFYFVWRKKKQNQNKTGNGKNTENSSNGWMLKTETEIINEIFVTYYEKTFYYLCVNKIVGRLF